MYANRLLECGSIKRINDAGMTKVIAQSNTVTTYFSTCDPLKSTAPDIIRWPETYLPASSFRKWIARSACATAGSYYLMTLAIAPHSQPTGSREQDGTTSAGLVTRIAGRHW